MANAIKPLYGSVTAFTIATSGAGALASLASSTSGAGIQTAMIDNSSTRYAWIVVAASIKVGTSPTANKTIQFYALRGNRDTTHIHDDGAGDSNANWTRKTADYLYTPGGRSSIINIGSAATGDVFSGVWILDKPGPEFAVGVVHDTGVALNSTASNHVISWFGVNPEIQ